MTKPQIIALVITLAALALIVDSHMPLASVKIDLTDTVSLKILLYDSEDGFLQMIFRNTRHCLQFIRENPNVIK